MGRKLVLIGIILLIAVLLAVFLPGRTVTVEKTGISLGTVCRIKLFTSASRKDKAEILLEDLFNTLKSAENLISARQDGTDIARINTAAGKSPVEISSMTFDLIAQAMNLSKATGGAFNPLIGAVTLIWNIGSGNERIPPGEIIERLPELTNPENLVLEYINGTPTAFLKLEGMALDLGAIGKGWAADMLSGIVLSSSAADCAVINLGGNITVCGPVERAVGIQNPEEERGTYSQVIGLKNKTASTSGAYERKAVIDGVTYHHIIDPETGYPAESPLKSVTVISPSGTRADALSTAIYVNPSLESLLGTDETCIK